MKDIQKLSDEKIVELSREKDKEFFVHIIRRYQDKLMRYANYLLGDEHMAADVVQESFIKAYINLNGFDIRKKFGSYIYRIVHNEAINLIHKRKKEVPLYEDVDFDSEENIEDEYVKKEMRNRTNNCLGKMPVIYKEPLSLYFLEEKSYEEISNILRIPMGTVATRINRAKVIMKKICQQIK